MKYFIPRSFRYHNHYLIENLSEIICTLRLQKRLSQDYVAAKLGLSQSQYSKKETGQKEFPLNKLVSFTAIIGIEPMRLFECLLLGTTRPDDAVGKLVQQINNRAAPLSEADDAAASRVLAAYFEQKYFALYREYLKLCEKLGMEPKSKNSGVGGLKSP